MPEIHDFRTVNTDPSRRVTLPYPPVGAVPPGPVGVPFLKPQGPVAGVGHGQAPELTADQNVVLYPVGEGVRVDATDPGASPRGLGNVSASALLSSRAGRSGAASDGARRLADRNLQGRGKTNAKVRTYTANFWTWFGSLPTGGQVAIGLMGGLILMRVASALKG